MNQLSLGDAANILKLDKTTLLRLENGRVPSAETLVAVLDFLLKAPKVKK